MRLFTLGDRKQTCVLLLCAEQDMSLFFTSHVREMSSMAWHYMAGRLTFLSIDLHYH